MPEPILKSVTANLISFDYLRKRSLEELLSIFQDINDKESSGIITIGNEVTHASNQKSDGGHLLILEKELTSRINILSSFSKLKESTGISKVIWLDYDDEHTYDYNALLKQFDSVVIILLNRSLNDLKKLATFLKKKLLIFSSPSKYTNLITVDHGMAQSTKSFFQEQGVWENLSSVYSWKMGTFAALDNDIITLEMENGGLGPLLRYNTIRPIEEMASALLRLVFESNYKIRITNVYLKGNLSTKLWKIYQKLYSEHLTQMSANERKRIEDQDSTLFTDQFSFFNRNVDFVCLDRGVDFVSCLLSELCYSGLCNEVFGTKLGIVNYTRDNKEKINIRLGDPKDKIYPKIRDLNFSMVGSVLNENARELQTEYDKRSQLKNISEMKDFVEGLNGLKEMQTFVQKHTLLAEHIVDVIAPSNSNEQLNAIFGKSELNQTYYEQFIDLQQSIVADTLDSKSNCTAILDFMYKYDPDISDVVRLLILTSIVKSGIREQEYKMLKEGILNNYGVQYVSLFLRLQDLHLLYSREPQLNFLSTRTTVSDTDKDDVQLIRNFKSVVSSMNLMPVEESQEPSEVGQPSFALPGYVPLTTRLVEAIYDRDFLSAEDGSRKQTTAKNARYRKYGWDNLRMSDISGEVYQDLLVPESKRGLFSTLIPPKLASLSSRYHVRRDMIIVSIIGGITYSEIATIRYVLSRNESTRGKQLLILTTGIIKGKDVVESLI